MGLFDQFTNLSPEQNQGLLAAAASLLQSGGPSRMPTSFGQALGGGLTAYQQSTDASRKRKIEEARAAQLQQAGAQGLEAGQLDIDQRRQAMAQEQLLQGAYGEAGGDPSKLIDAVSRVDPMKGFQLRQQLAKSTEFDTKPQVGVDEQGNPFTYILGKNGEQKRLAGTLPRDELKLANLGGKDVAYNPYALQPGQTFQRTQDPNSVASNATAIRGQDISRQNAIDALLAPTYNQEAGGFITRPTAANPSGMLTPLAGAAPRGPKLTEDQGKATGWLVQAENAFKNLKAVGIDKKGEPTSAAKPGVIDLIGAVPGFGGAANALRSEDRQKFMQASSSLSEALLRAATGAGVNKEEALQKIQELTPVFGEESGTTQQKFDAIPLYIESLKVRAGAGAPLAAGVINANSPKRITLADIAATAAASGKTTAEVTAAAKNAGYTIGGK